MAAADYRLCDVCNRKTFYDAELDYDQPQPGPGFLPVGAGAWAVLCEGCVDTHEIVVAPRQAARALSGEG